MSAPIFCKFSHRMSLQAHGGVVAIHDNFGKPFIYNLGGVVITGAVNLRENLVHVLTTDGLFEIDGVGEDLRIKRIGETL